MNEKFVDFGTDAGDSLRRGINTLSNAVKSTLGAAGKTVIIEDEFGRPHVTKDGVTVAKSIILDHPVENMGASIVREASIKTSDKAGDGTTTSVVLAQDLIRISTELLRADDKMNVSVFREHLDDLSKEIIEFLDSKVKKVTKKGLSNVASISANNDKELGSIIADAFNKVGADGAVSVETSPTNTTYIKVVEGTRMKRGYVSPYLITDKEKSTSVLENALVLLSDKKVTKWDDIKFYLEASVTKKVPLLIVADVDQAVMANINTNKLRGALDINVVAPEGVGNNRLEILNDLAVMTGAIVVSDDTGVDWNNMSIDNLGLAKKVTSTANQTIITLSGETKKQVIEQAGIVRKILENKEDKPNIWHHKDRLSRLAGGVATIYVGAYTEVELKEKKDRVDDAISATRAALEEGVIPGGGASLLHASLYLLHKYSGTKLSSEKDAAIFTITQALTSPISTIMSNAGLEFQEIDIVIKQVGEADFNTGYDVKRRVVVDMTKSGIIDPAKVTKSAFSNAMSVAQIVLQTDCIITNLKEKFQSNNKIANTIQQQ
jgi:chaperonin GroEL|tara:strand:- start:4898 stop:6541 length:1644 start_codon:yes stop_codon:yes gene_type:complete